MTDNLEKVRDKLANPEDIDPGDVPAAGGDGPRTPAPPDNDPPEDPESGDRLPAIIGGEFPLNDFGNGQRFGLHFGDDLMWVPRVGWFAWTGMVWRKDPDTIEVRRRAQKVAALIKEEIPHLALDKWDMDKLAEEDALNAQLRELTSAPDDQLSDEQRDVLVRIEAKLRRISSLKKLLGSKKTAHRGFARTSGNTARIQSLMTEGAIEMSRRFDELDQNPLDVNTEAGVLRFSVTGGPGEGFSKVAEIKVVGHDRDQLLTKMMPVAYDPDARCPQFDRFIERIQPNESLRQFLQRWCGLSMTGLTGEQKLAFFYGDGANGKSVLVDLIARIMGDYSATAKIESLTGRNRRSGGDATPDLVPLMGARMVRASEPEEGERLQEGKIKELTGGEPILVRALQEDFVEVSPEFKLTISGNHKPQIRGTDDGIWRRLLLVPFDVKIPPDQQDRHLVGKLFREAPGILNWMVEGLMDYLEGGLREPEQVLEATQEYRSESDPIGTFLTDCSIFTQNTADIVSTSELGNAFSYWLMEQGLDPWKKTTFTKQLVPKSRAWRHPKSGLRMVKGKSSRSQYECVRFVEPFKRRFDDAPKDHHGRPLSVKKEDDA